MSKEMVKKEQTAVTEFTADSMFSDMDIPQGRRRIPMIKLLQSNSNEVAEEGEKLGTYYNNLTKDNYGEGFKFIPVKFYFGAAYLDLSKGLICKSNDGITNINGEKCAQCPHNVYYKNWISAKKPNKCVDTIDVIGVVPEVMEPVVISFKSKSYPAGQDMAFAVRKRVKSGDTGIYEFVVHSKLDSNDAGRYYVSKVQRPVLATNLDVLQVVQETHKMIKEQEFDVQEDGGSNGGTR